MHKEGRFLTEGHSGMIRVVLGYIHSTSMCNSSISRSSLCTPSASWLSERLSAGGNWAWARCLFLSLSRVHRSHTAAGNDTLEWVTSAAVSHPVIGESSVLLGRGAPCTPAPKYIGKFWNHSVSLHPPHPFGLWKWAEVGWSCQGRGSIGWKIEGRRGAGALGHHQVAAWAPGGLPPGRGEGQSRGLPWDAVTQTPRGNTVNTVKQHAFSVDLSLSQAHKDKDVINIQAHPWHLTLPTSRRELRARHTPRLSPSVSAT